MRNAPFLVEKLQIKILPCVIAWKDGYAQTKYFKSHKTCVQTKITFVLFRIVGFDELGNTDSFQTAALELKLIHAGVIKKKEDKSQSTKKSIFQSTDTDSELDDD